jgi:hypothetical protein
VQNTFARDSAFLKKVQNFIKNNIHGDVYSELTPPRVTRLAHLVQRHNCNDCTGDSGRSCCQAHLRIPRGQYDGHRDGKWNDPAMESKCNVRQL